MKAEIDQLTVRKTLWRFAAIALCTALSGCFGSEKVARVSGTLTLDDKPLSGAYIIFNPVAPGGQSSAISDESGNYTLQYTRELKGAELGEHTVRITTGTRGDPDSDPPLPRSPERLPPKYHSKSELKATVSAGTNDIDFDLKSAGTASQAARVK